MLSTSKIGGRVAAVGLAADMKLSTSVAPFILRGVHLLGVDSVNCPMDLRQTLWNKLAVQWRPDRVHDQVRTIDFDGVDHGGVILAPEIAGKHDGASRPVELHRGGAEDMAGAPKPYCGPAFLRLILIEPNRFQLLERRSRTPTHKSRKTRYSLR